MFVRCPECLCATWWEAAEGGQISLECWYCHETLEIQDRGGLQTSPEERLRRVKELAQSHQIDLPSAGSVELGVMTLEEACSEKVRESTARDVFGNRASEVQVRLSDVDKKADQLVRVHGIPKPLALAVAEDRTSLRKALGRIRRQAKSGSETRVGPQTRLLIGSVAILLGAGLVYSGLTLRDRSGDENKRVPPPVNHTTGGPAVVRQDDNGRILEVRGSSPQHVLITFCQHSAASPPLEPLLVGPSSPPRPGARVGVIVDSADRSVRYAIDLQRRGGPHEWSAGNGSDPIELRPAPDFPPGTPVLPIETGR